MRSKKYEILKDDTLELIDGSKLHRIMALKDFGYIKKGSLGGYIENEYNLSQKGKSWIFNNACVYEEARVYDNAQVFGKARVFGKAKVCRNARVSGHARISGNTRISGNADIYSE